MDKSAQRLAHFRSEAYQLLGGAKDATFDLMDAVVTTRTAYSFAELSLSPVFRRKWASIYEAIDDCRPKTNKLMKLAWFKNSQFEVTKQHKFSHLFSDYKDNTK